MSEQDKRERLIVAATRLFAQKGYAAVSIRLLAQTANVNSALVSYYFGGKEGLYKEVLQSQFHQVVARIENIDKALPPIQRLECFAWTMAQIHQDFPYLLRFGHSEMTNPTKCFAEIIKPNIARLYQFLHQTVEEGVAAGYFRADVNPGYAAVGLASILNFYFIARPVANSVLGSLENQDGEYVRQAIELYLHGLERR
ncbi:TetR family transcriptional regulator [Anaerospora sp.]|uniref:TetR/AcrR family transcriptional regulator n=1 Tax=Anaerospora sp. TaxID=1960278 RepID=UPI0028976C9B|nr:TetR family transcriptional regulator [Anaerospora sp.]